MPRMFTESASQFIESKIIEARQRANQIEDRRILTEDNNALISEALGKTGFSVAVLDSVARFGKRANPPSGSSQDGPIDVHIPFKGFRRSFDLGPSSMRLIEKEENWTNTELIVRFSDDDNLDRNVDQFVEHVSYNLRQLSEELATTEARQIAAIQADFRVRADKLNARAERDSKRSFPIR